MESLNSMTSDTPLPRLMTIDDAAEALHCHPETLRRAIRQKRLSCYRIGGLYRLSAEQLKTYLESAQCLALGQTAPSSPDIAENGVSASGMETALAGSRQVRRMSAALDSSSRISRPDLKVIRSN
jgi:excisionase family DNA binding protein